MGSVNVRTATQAGAQIIALCDVDEAQMRRVQKYYPDASQYQDYRQLLAQETDIDAVIISTPNHSHAVIALAAMALGKHVYCEKPLAHTLLEVRKMTEAARRHKVATQLGNQGHSYATSRELGECISSGTIGTVREIHLVEAAFNFSQFDRLPDPDEEHAIPATLDWELWLGPVPYRRFHPSYHPGMWRGFRPFSSGMIGDFFCHAGDPMVSALNLGAPTTIMAEDHGYDARQLKETFPRSSRIHYEFPAEGARPPVALYWYDGDHFTPPRPEELSDDEETIPILGAGGVGGLVVGEQGKIIYGSHGAAEWRIIPEARMQEYLKSGTRSPDPRGQGMPDNLAHHLDFLQACRGGESPGSNFDHGGPLTEIAILGNIAQQLPGTKLEWDAENMTFPNHPEADQLLHYQYREGWTL
jgi:hypothetical protein|tara:strand:+ start:12761 stop:14002 length:1242 start_codon:yes stop_codon:yes gene_type:complete